MIELFFLALAICFDLYPLFLAAGFDVDFFKLFEFVLQHLL